MQLQASGVELGSARPRCGDVVTVEMVPARLAEGVRVLGALPGVGVRPRGYGNSLYFAHPLPEWRPAGDDAVETTPSAISRAEEALGWLALIHDDRTRERRVLLLRASGWIWQRIGNEVGLSHEGARKAHAAGVRLIADALNRRQRIEPSRLA